jgi:hypothetical protein
MGQSLSGRGWCPYALGGWLAAYHDDVTCVVNWANNGEELRASDKARIQNEGFFFREGISWHSAPQYPSNQTRMNARLMPEGSIFTNSVHCFFPKETPIWEMLGYLNSEFVFYLIRVFEIRKILNGMVAALPFPAKRDFHTVGRHARSAHQLLLALTTSNESSPFFVAPAILLATCPPARLGKPSGHVHAPKFCWPSDESVSSAATCATRTFGIVYAEHGSTACSLRQLVRITLKRKAGLEAEVTLLQKRIDDAVYGLLNISPEDRKRIAEEIAFRQCQPALEEDQQEQDQANEAADAAGDRGAIDTAASESEEAFARDQVARLFAYAVKVITERDEDGIVSISRAGPKATLAERVKAQLGEWFGADQVDAKWADASEILGKSVDDWLAQDFFDYHVNLYRRRPIFWQLTSAHCGQRTPLPGAFSCLIHYHKLRGNTLQNILAHYLAPSLEAAQAQFDATRAVLDAQEQRGANRRELTASRRAFTEADKRLRELLEFQRRLHELDTGARPVQPAPGPDDAWVKQKIAEVTGGPAFGGRGWLPVIDYGVRVNIEPLKVARVLPRAADRIE